MNLMMRKETNIVSNSILKVSGYIPSSAKRKL